MSIQLTEEKLSSLSLLPIGQSYSGVAKNIQLIIEELNAYINNPRHRFNLPLHIEGTPFQKMVWKALQAIPSGTVISYQDLAKKLETSPRAIGNACRANPIAIVIPCHRVVAKKGMGGFCGKTSGKMTHIKKWLLRHEGVELS